MTRARDLADSADKDIAGTLTLDDLTVSGSVTGDLTGDVTGNVTGNLTGNATGNLTGDVTGDVTGDITGEVTATKLNSTDSLPTVRPSLLLDFANSKTLDPRITFTRGSTATYWDGHTTTKAEENLYPYSQEVNNWPRTGGVTVTADAGTAPDGTTTADRLYAPSGWYRGNQFSLIAGETYTMSIYLKSNSGSNEQLVLFSENNVASSTLTVTTSWQRFTYTFTVSSSAISDYGVWSSSPTLGGVDVLAWGMQLEQRSSATAYTATGSYPIVKYQPVLQTAASGEARFDHDPLTGESKGLLIEEARTNLYTTSATWTNSTNGGNSYIESAVGLDGSVASTKVLTSLAQSNSYLYVSGVNVTSGTTYTISCWMKLIAGSNSDLNGNFYSASVPFASVTNYGKSDVNSETWTRVYATATATQTATTNITLNGYDSVAGTRIAYFGVQVEQGSFPTSYIPTSGSSATRSVDKCEVGSVANWYSADRGTMYAEYTQFGLGSLNTSGIWEIYDTSSGTTGWDLRNTSTESILYAQQGNGNQKVILSGTSTGGLDVEHRAVVSWSTNGIRVATEYDATSRTSGADATFEAYEMEIGRHDRNNSRVLNGHFKKVSYTPAEYNESTVRAMLEE